MNIFNIVKSKEGFDVMNGDKFMGRFADMQQATNFVNKAKQQVAAASKIQSNNQINGTNLAAAKEPNRFFFMPQSAFNQNAGMFANAPIGQQQPSAYGFNAQQQYGFNGGVGNMPMPAPGQFANGMAPNYSQQGAYQYPPQVAQSFYQPMMPSQPASTPSCINNYLPAAAPQASAQPQIIYQPIPSPYMMPWNNTDMRQGCCSRHCCECNESRRHHGHDRHERHDSEYCYECGEGRRGMHKYAKMYDYQPNYNDERWPAYGPDEGHDRSLYSPRQQRILEENRGIYQAPAIANSYNPYERLSDDLMAPPQSYQNNYVPYQNEYNYMPQPNFAEASSTLTAEPLMPASEILQNQEPLEQSETSVPFVAEETDSKSVVQPPVLEEEPKKEMSIQKELSPKETSDEGHAEFIGEDLTDFELDLGQKNETVHEKKANNLDDFDLNGLDDALTNNLQKDDYSEFEGEDDLDLGNPLDSDGIYSLDDDSEQSIDLNDDKYGVKDAETTLSKSELQRFKKEQKKARKAELKQTKINLKKNGRGRVNLANGLEELPPIN